MSVAGSAGPSASSGTQPVRPFGRPGDAESRSQTVIPMRFERRRR